MANFLSNNYENPKMKQSEIANPNQLGKSTSTLQRYRNEKYALTIQNSHK